MTATVHGGPSFQAWQMAHARRHDPRRATRLMWRWIAFGVALGMRALKQAFEALARAFAAAAEQIAIAVRPLAAALTDPRIAPL